jgi:hypothetical protein
MRLASSPAEKEAIYRLRYDVMVDGMGKPLSADHRRRIVDDALDDWADHLYIERQGEVVAAVRLNQGQLDRWPAHYARWYGLHRFAGFEEPDLSLSSRLVVGRRWWGSIVMAKLFLAAYSLGLQRGFRFNFCHCTPGLVGLYSQLGYRRYRENFVDGELGLRVPMVMVVRDFAYLQRSGSPCARGTDGALPDDECAAWFSQTFPSDLGYVYEPFSLDQFLAYTTAWARTRQPPLLRGLSELDLRELLRHGTLLRCRAGDVLYGEGSCPEEIFLLLEGDAHVTRSTPRGPVTTTVSAGQVMGEMSFLESTARGQRAVAASDLTVLVYGQMLFKKLLSQIPHVMVKVLGNLAILLCGRVREFQRELDRALDTGPNMFPPLGNLGEESGVAAPFGCRELAL